MPATGPKTALKRSRDEEIDGETKKCKVGQPVEPKPAPISNTITNESPNFVSAATLVSPMQEISDEELVEYMLEFERQHRIWCSINDEGKTNEH